MTGRVQLVSHLTFMSNILFEAVLTKQQASAANVTSLNRLVKPDPDKSSMYLDHLKPI